jgi:hypothetical protein
LIAKYRKRKRKMKTLNRRAAVVFIACISAISGGQTPPSVQQKAERSICANIVALTGDVKLNCSNLTEEQKKALKDIPAILKMAVSNQAYLAEILAKMEEMNRPQPAVTNNIAPGGFATSGGTLINPSVNNFGPPSAHLTFTEEVVQPLPPDGKGFKEIKIHIHTDRPIPGALIGIVLSDPMDVSKEYWDGHNPSQEGSGSSQVDRKGSLSRNGILLPNSFALFVAMPAAFNPGIDLVVPVRSAYDVHVLEITTLSN